MSLTDALNSGSYGDLITIYEGYRQDDGSLVDDPWVVARGTFEYASVNLGESNEAVVVMQHDLSRIQEKHGGKWSSEDQLARFGNDIGFRFVHESAFIELTWGGRDVRSSGGGSNFYNNGDRDGNPEYQG